MVDDPVLVVAVDDVARAMRLPLPLSADDSWRLSRAIQEAQFDVEAYLGRPITPTVYVEYGLWPIQGDIWWSLCHAPLIEVLSSVAETIDGQATGTFTVTYTAGLDAANDPQLAPIRRYVAAAAMASPMMIDAWRATRSDGGRVVSSLSTEGQSVSFKYASPLDSSGAGSGTATWPGSPPRLDSLDRWRLAGRRVFQRRERGVWSW
jgi:hypothetical protein